MPQQIQGPPTEDLEALLTYLETKYYAVIDGLCLTISMQLDYEDAHAPQETTSYNSLCKKLIGQVAQYTRLRQLILLPYILELIEKQDTGHDCRHCSSSCTIRHTLRLAEIREAHAPVKELLDQLTLQPCTNAALHREVMLLAATLIELFHIETSVLIPGLVATQKNIHAHD